MLSNAPKIHPLDLNGKPKHWLTCASLLLVMVRGREGPISAQSYGILQLAREHAGELKPAQAIPNAKVGQQLDWRQHDARGQHGNI